MSKAKKIVKKAVSNAIDPFDLGFGDMIKGEGGKEGLPSSATITAPTPDMDETARRKERELARRYAGAGRAGTALSEGSKLG